MRHPLVAIEGIDGSGKATMSAALAAQYGGQVFAFPEYGTVVGQALLGNLRGEWFAHKACESVIAYPAGKSADAPMACLRPLAETHGVPLNALVRQALMTVNRYQAQNRLLAALEKAPLILDRYWLSSLAYGLAEGLPEQIIRDMSSALLQPDLTIILDMPAERVRERRPQARDRNEENLHLLSAVRENYRALISGRSGLKNVFLVDADRPLEVVKNEVISIYHRQVYLKQQFVCFRLECKERCDGVHALCLENTPAPFLTSRRELVTCKMCQSILNAPALE